MKAKIEYKVLKDEFHGLIIITAKNGVDFKLYVSPSLLEKYNLTFWQDADYYKSFIEKNIESFVERVENGTSQKFHDGFLIN